jgi:FHA domain
LSYWIRYRGTHFPIRREKTLVGRSAYCSIVLSNGQASRQHCAFEITTQGLTVTDLSSRNGTFVNGEKVVGTRELRPGDVIRIGSDALEVVDGVEPERRAERITGVDLDDTTGHGDIDLVDLVESLVGADPGDQGFVAVVAAVDDAFATLSSAVERGHLSRLKIRRALAAAARVAAWFPDGSRDIWLERLRARFGGSIPP